MAQSKPFFGGIPVGPDVKKLQERYGIPEVGRLLPHEELAALLGVPWRSSRYRTVVNSWRERLFKDSNVDVLVEPGVGLRILSGPERIDASASDFKSAVRKTHKAHVRVTVTPENGLDAAKLQLRDHLRQATSRIYLAMAGEVRALTPPKSPPQLPRPQAG